MGQRGTALGSGPSSAPVCTRLHPILITCHRGIAQGLNRGECDSVFSNARPWPCIRITQGTFLVVPKTPPRDSNMAKVENHV